MAHFHVHHFYCIEEFDAVYWAKKLAVVKRGVATTPLRRTRVKRAKTYHFYYKTRSSNNVYTLNHNKFKFFKIATFEFKATGYYGLLEKKIKKKKD